MEQVYSSISQEITRMNCTYKQTQNIAYYSGLEEAQAGIKTAGRNINNLRYADDTILIAESKEKQPLDESERRKIWLKSKHSKN